ncbi:AT-rich interactive domain-containing protein 4A isoform X3 [Ixodes scapularis]|uniref:AT-rich interactive domain-containing protein 4A isoform X3 n=1 Tax=Ixodes scapularis TaxID=6945 RepID=UPI001C384B56|nr:AT-rich interactive domain-containing protein 4A isoform X3 [Ixodes scapularis]
MLCIVCHDSCCRAMKYLRKSASDEPLYLTVGTDVSAKYRGAFCEAKIKKVNRMVKCRVTFKNNHGTHVIPDDHIKGGTLRVGAHVEAKHPDKNQFFDAVVGKLLDYSQYTVVFDDGDETTLRRTSLCLKSGRHFAESETLDQLPLTNPEHFGTPVMGSKFKRKRRSVLSAAAVMEDDSSEDEALPTPTPPKKSGGGGRGERGGSSASSATSTGGRHGNATAASVAAASLSSPSLPDWSVGRVGCLDVGDKRKRDSWVPVLVVSPSATGSTGGQLGRDELLVRSFRDSKFFQVTKRELREFSRDSSARVESNALRSAVDRALAFLDQRVLPPNWDQQELLPRNRTPEASSPAAAAADEDEQDSQSDVSDDEPSEEKDRFVAQLYKFMDERGTPINKGPAMGGRDLNLYRLFRVVGKLGGCNRVTNHNQWRDVYRRLGLPAPTQANTNLLRGAYKKYLQSFEDFYRKLGCTMVSNPRSGRVRHRSDRIMTRNQDRGLALFARKEKEKKEDKAKEEDKEEDKKTKEKPAPPAAPTAPAAAKEEPAAEKPRPSRAIRASGAKADEDSSSGSSSASPAPAKLSAATSADDTKVRTREDARREKNESPDKRESRSSSGNAASSRKGESVERSQPDATAEEASPDDRAPPRAVKVKREEGETAPTPPALKRQMKKSKPDDSAEREKQEDDSAAPSSSTESEPRSESRGEGGEPPQRRWSLDVSIDVGDRVKVKYGRGRQLKIYEAKVLRIEEEAGDKKFYVHYTGWNMRYDEWVRKNRIVENVTDKTARRKRLQKERQGAEGSQPQQKSNSGGSSPPTAPPGGGGASSDTGSASKKGGVRRGRPPSVSGSRSQQGGATQAPPPAQPPTPPPQSRPPSLTGMPTRATRSDRGVLSECPFAGGLEPRRRSRRKSGTQSPPDGDDEDISGEDEAMSERSHASVKVEHEQSDETEKGTSVTDSSEDVPPPSAASKSFHESEVVRVKEEVVEETERPECDDEDTDIDDGGSMALAFTPPPPPTRSHRKRKRKSRLKDDEDGEEDGDESEEEEAESQLPVEEEPEPASNEAEEPKVDEGIATAVADDEDSLLDEGSLVIFEEEESKKPEEKEDEIVEAPSEATVDATEEEEAEEADAVSVEVEAETELPAPRQVVPVTRVITIFPPPAEVEVGREEQAPQAAPPLEKEDKEEEEDLQKEAASPLAEPDHGSAEELAEDAIEDVLLLPPSLVAREGPERDALLAPENSLPASEFEVCKVEEEEEEEEEEDEEAEAVPASPNMASVEPAVEKDADPAESGCRIEFVKEESESASTQDFFKVALLTSSDDGSSSNALRVVADEEVSSNEVAAEPVEFPSVGSEDAVLAAVEVEVGPPEAAAESPAKKVVKKKFGRGGPKKFDVPEAKLKGRKKTKVAPDGSPLKSPRMKKCRKGMSPAAEGEEDKPVKKRRSKFKCGPGGALAAGADSGEDKSALKKEKRKMRKGLGKDGVSTEGALKKGRRRKFSTTRDDVDSEDDGGIERTFAGKIKRDKRKAVAAPVATLIAIRPSPPSFHHDYLSTLAEVCGQEVEMKTTAGTDLHAESADSLFLLCEEKVPASPVREGDDELAGHSSHHHHHHHHHPHHHHQPHHAHSHHQQQQPQRPTKMDIFTSVAEAALAGPSNADPSAPVLDNTPPTTPDGSGGADSSSPGVSPAPQRRDTAIAAFHGTLDGESTMSADSEDNNSRGSADGPVSGFKRDEDDDSSSRTTDSASSGEPGRKEGGTKRRDREEEAGLLGHGKRAKKAARKGTISGADDGARVRQHQAMASARSARELLAGSQISEGGGAPMSAGMCSLGATAASTTCHRPSKFTFDHPLDEGLDAEKRISVLQDRLTELRKVYLSLKAEVAVIDRRRKRARKKESSTPASSMTPTVPVSQPPTSSSSSCSPAPHQNVQLEVQCS